MNSMIYVVCGPTASGKSAYALKKAKQTNGVIINADSMQIYKDTPILSAIPSADDMRIAPHKLYSIINYHESFSVAKWLNLVVQAIKEARLQKLTPIVVGGTGMYINALLYGLSVIPTVNEEVCIKAKDLYESNPQKAFGLVKEKDKFYAEKIGPNNKQRICRFLEVYFATGKSIREFQQSRQAHFRLEDFQITYIKPPREIVYENCNARFLQMIKQGAINEVKLLMQDKKIKNFTKVHGVKQIREYMLGNITLEKAIQESQQITRNYVKRQYTWFNNQLPDNQVICAAQTIF